MTELLLVDTAAASAAPFASTSFADTNTPHRTLGSAEFERLYAQAELEQAQVALVNPADSMAQQSVGAVATRLNGLSGEYVQSVTETHQALKNLDITDPAAVSQIMERMLVATVKGAEFSLMIKEISESKKGLSQLFHNQG
jgi:hypothetical protein